MISNLRISLVELVIWAVFAMAGLAWTLARVFDGLERAWDWWRYDRVTPLLEDDDYQLGYNEDTGQYEELPPLPPERTWEQMTSHQLPIETALKRIGLPYDHDWDPNCRVRGCPVHGNWDQQRERRPPAYEAEMRAHYVAMGFDYPSGLMARVRELTP